MIRGGNDRASGHLNGQSRSTGFKGVAANGVSFNSSRGGKPYQAHVYRGGKQVTLGVFATAEDAGAEDTPTSEDFSGTNVQEEGVDEADTVKTSGDFIYKVGEIRGGAREADGSLEDCAYRLSVVEDTDEGLRLVASVDLEPLDTTPEAMFHTRTRPS